MKNKTSFLYWQIYCDIITQIKEDRLSAGDKLEREVDLAARYGVSRSTIRKALDYLCRMNLIYRVKKGGTFINGKFSRDFYKIIPTILPFKEDLHAQLVSGIQTCALARNSFSPVYDSIENVEREREFLESLLELNVDGLILYPCTGIENLDILYKFKARGIPIIFLDRRVPGIDSPLVTSNNVQGMTLAVNHLLELGHKDIVFSAININSIQPEQDRLRGFLETLTKAGAAASRESIFSLHNLSDKLIKYSPKHQTDYYNSVVKKSFTKMLSAPKPPTAVAFLNDYLAMNFIKFAGSYGLRIPEDISITGFDDVPGGKNASPPLTTVRQNFFEIGKTAVELMLSQINGSAVPRTSLIDTEFLVRGSTAAPNGGVECGNMPAPHPDLSAAPS